MAELRGGRDELDGSDLPARRYPADTGDGAGEARPRAEPGPRGEYAVAISQIVDQRPAGEGQTDQPESSQAEAAQANANQAEAAHADGGQAGVDQEEVNQEDTSPTGAGQEDAAQEDNAADPNEVGAGQLDAGQANGDLEDADQTNTDQADADPEGADPGGTGQDDADPADADQAAEPADRGALERFEPSRAGLPEVSYEDAAAYIEEHLADRPWLATVRTCSRDVQRVFVALDQGHGHAHIRHDGWVTEEMNERRIRKLEDPAQLDPEKREDRVDAFKVGNQPHWCGSIATRITNPEIFAETFARGAEHPDVRAALESKDPIPPGPVAVPISDLLGPDGHRFCCGSQLEPVDGSMTKARNYRDAWAEGDHSGPEPRIQPVETFEGGTVTFTFHARPLGGYEVNTMYVNPPSEKP